MNRRKIMAAFAAMTLIPIILLAPTIQDPMTTDTHLLSGTWTKISTDPCAAIYPPEIVLKDGGIYDAPGAPEAGALWHGGDWNFEEPGTLIMQTSNDAMRSYTIVKSSESELTIIDSSDCSITYTRTDER